MLDRLLDLVMLNVVWDHMYASEDCQLGSESGIRFEVMDSLSHLFSKMMGPFALQRSHSQFTLVDLPHKCSLKIGFTSD